MNDLKDKTRLSMREAAAYLEQLEVQAVMDWRALLVHLD